MDNSTLVPIGSPGHDRLGKVCPVIDHMSRCFREIYDPYCEVAVDQTMIKFQGRSSLKQYMQKKPTKRGIKRGCLVIAEMVYFPSFKCTQAKKGVERQD